MKKIFSFLTALLFAGSMTAANYVKVTADLTDWAGDYLIVHEASGVAFDGSLEALDAVENTISVTINEGAIEATDATNAAKFTIAAMEGGYSVKAASGKFIGQTAFSNGLRASDDAIVHSLGIDASGNANLVVTTSGGDVSLRFNKATNQLRFRYYKSGQEAIALYKLSEGGEGGEGGETETDEVVYDWAGAKGVTVLGATGVEISTVKIHQNADAVDAIKIGSSYVYADGKYIAIKPAEGGFKAGDVLNVTGVISNSDETKYAQVDVYAADGETRLLRSENLLNARLSADDPEALALTLESDQDSLLLGRYGNTNLFIIALKVIRPAEVVPAVTYTVAGSNATILGTSWDPANAANDMTKQEDGTYKWEKTGLELSAGSLQFKVCKDHSWDVSYPGENYELKFDESGVYTVTITFEPENGNKVSAVATKTADLVVLPKVVLHGNFTGSWADTDEFVASEDKKSVSLELTLGEGSFNFGFKFDGSWKANGATIDRDHNTTSLAEGAGDMTIVSDQAGKYTFVYTFETQTVDVTYPALVVKKTCAEVYSLEKNTEVALKSVVVTGVIGKNVYVRDATAAMLLYFPSNATLNTGDVLSGVTGVVDIYNGIYEVKLNATQVAAIVAVGGAAPVPETITAIDAEKDMSKLVLLEGIELEGEFAEGTMSNINISFAGGTYVLRNQLKNAYVFESGKKYDITALVTLYQNNIQFYFISAQEHQEPAKFYITGIGGDWSPTAIKSTEDSYVLHLEAGDHLLKVTVDGTWETVKGFTDLTEVADGLTKSDDEYNNICFTLDEAGDVTVTYTETVFKLEGNFHVDVVPADRRINAWGLNVVGSGESYTFSYNANIDGNEANLVFFKNGEEVGSIEIDAPKKGANEAVVAKEELPAGKDLTWGVELKANPVTEFAKLAEGANLKKCHLAIDNSPESDFFGRMYVANRAGTADGGIYVYNQDYTVNTENTLAGQPKWQSMGRPSVGADGTVYIGDWGDAHGGVYVMNPSTLTATCLFEGEQDGSGVWTNNGVALGSSTASVGVYGEGANTVLYAMNEDVSSAGTTLYKHGVNVYQLGQEDGSVLSTWKVAPTKTFALSDNAAEMFVINATSKGAFFSCSRAKPNNTSGARSLQFYNTNGERTFVALPEGETADLTGSLGGGCAVSRDEDLLAIVDGDGNILVYAVDWNEDTPSLTKITKYETEFAALGSLCFDFAGNIVVTAGTNYNNSTANKLVAYGVPTENNEILVPAKKALTVSGVATAIEDSFVPVKVEKVIRNGQVLIIKDGKTYNMMGQIVK